VPAVMNTRTSAGRANGLPPGSVTRSEALEDHHSYSLSAWMTFGQVRVFRQRVMRLSRLPVKGSVDSA
jgi:hypothetical protein